ncbi:hypothetical protein V2O64_08040 [Verrucomicrobiaceae bacterium 227]
MKLNNALLTILASGVATGLASSETITADVADASARANGASGQNTNNVLFAGSYYADGPGISPIFPFLLPDLGPGAPFGTATLTLELQSLLRAPVTFNGDIIGLERIDESPNVLGEDWGSDGTLLHDDFYTPTSPLGVSTTNDFAAWLNTQYADGANAGKFVFIRVDTNIDDVRVTTGRSAYTIATADNLDLQKPTIEYETGSGDKTLAITGVKHQAENITLTWRKTGAAFYIAKFSPDMTDWVSELDDNITDERDENPDDADNLTVTFPLSDIANAPKAFFRIEEG